jgi:hypothetical protein
MSKSIPYKVILLCRIEKRRNIDGGVSHSSTAAPGVYKNRNEGEAKQNTSKPCVCKDSCCEREAQRVRMNDRKLSPKKS